MKKPVQEPEEIVEGYKRVEPKLSYDYLKKSNKTVTYAPPKRTEKQLKLDADRVYEDGQSLILEVEEIEDAMEYVDDMYAEDVYDEATYAEDCEHVESADGEGEGAEPAEEPKEEKKYSLFDRALSFAHGTKYGAAKGGYGGSYSRAHLAGPGMKYGRQIYGSQAEAAQAHGGYQFQTLDYGVP